MSTGPTAVIEEGPGGLDERILATLQTLHGRIAFSGLRRVLHAHPESLSRSLRRLEREGRVDRSSDGYRITEEALDASHPSAPQLRPIGQVTLPPGTVAESVLGRLAGRWFGSLRWVGVVEGPSGQLLTWAKRDGSAYILLGVRRGSLRVYLRDQGAADDVTEAEDAAYELMVHALDALRPSRFEPSSPVGFLSAGVDPGGAFSDN